MTRGEEALFRELAQLGAVFHWPLSELLDLEHTTRARFLRAARELDPT